MSAKGFFVTGVLVLLVAAAVIFAAVSFYPAKVKKESAPQTETMPLPPMEAPAEDAEMESSLAEPLLDGVPQANGGVAGKKNGSATSDAPSGSFSPLSATIPGLADVLLNGDDVEVTGRAPAGTRMSDSPTPPVVRNGAGAGGDLIMEDAAAIPSLGTEAQPENGRALDKYKVELGVDAQLQKPGPAGELKVWIGAPELAAEFSPGMTTAETTVPAIGQTAEVSPVAPDFEVSPAENICMKIHPSGSEARFTLKPKATGSFKVSADVLLYESHECTGLPVRRSPARLTVEVVVNKKGVAIGYLLELWDILWQGILDFWTWLVAAVAGLFIFLIRKRLKKLFGYDAPDLGQ